MTHVWPDGLQLEVQCDAMETPTRLRLRGQWHTVEEVSARWRVRRGWWERGRWREYLTVATSSRLLLTLARELPDGAWALLYLYD
jgi:hypothetical protein